MELKHNTPDTKKDGAVTPPIRKLKAYSGSSTQNEKHLEFLGYILLPFLTIYLQNTSLLPPLRKSRVILTPPSCFAGRRDCEPAHCTQSSATKKPEADGSPGLSFSLRKRTEANDCFRRRRCNTPVICAAKLGIMN